jgi:hypothetical protein
VPWPPNAQASRDALEARIKGRGRVQRAPVAVRLHRCGEFQLKGVSDLMGLVQALPLELEGRLGHFAPASSLKVSQHRALGRQALGQGGLGLLMRGRGVLIPITFGTNLTVCRGHRVMGGAKRHALSMEARDLCE